MATKVVLLHRDSGLMKNGFFGFSWTTLIFGPFPALFRGDYLTFIGVIVVIVIISVITFGIGGFIAAIIWAFLYNKYYTRKLLECGYIFHDTEPVVAQAKIALGVANQ